MLTVAKKGDRFVLAGEKLGPQPIEVDLGVVHVYQNGEAILGFYDEDKPNPEDRVYYAVRRKAGEFQAWVEIDSRLEKLELGEYRIDPEVIGEVIRRLGAYRDDELYTSQRVVDKWTAKVGRQDIMEYCAQNAESISFILDPVSIFALCRPVALMVGKEYGGRVPFRVRPVVDRVVEGVTRAFRP